MTMRIGFLVMFLVLLVSCGSAAKKEKVAESTATLGGDVATTTQCSVAEDCSYWYCSCTDGGVVNGRFCSIGQCASAAGTCPSACEGFGTTWDGTTVVVDDGATGGGTSSGGGSSGGSGLTCSGVDPVLRDGSDCTVCLDVECCSDLQFCSDSPDCVAFFDCLSVESFEVCDAAYPNGSAEFNYVGWCAEDYCEAECL